MTVMKKLYALVLAVAMLFAPLGCSDSDYRKATRAAAGISSGLHALEDVNEQLYAAGMTSKDEAAAIAHGVVSATLANDQVVAQLRAVKTIDGSTRQQVGAWFGSVISSLDVLNSQGVLGVKNPDARAKLAAAFATIQTSVAVITQLLAQNGIAIQAEYSSSRDGISPAGLVRAPDFSLEPPMRVSDTTAECEARLRPDDPDIRRCTNTARLALASVGGAN